MTYYPAEYVYRYKSRIRPPHEFRSAEAALAQDLEWAATLVGNLTAPALREAITDATPDLKAALELLADYAKSPTPLDKDELPF